MGNYTIISVIKISLNRTIEYYDTIYKLGHGVMWFPWRILNLPISRGGKEQRREEKKGGEKRRERREGGYIQARRKRRSVLGFDLANKT